MIAEVIVLLFKRILIIGILLKQETYIPNGMYK